MIQKKPIALIVSVLSGLLFFWGCSTMQKNTSIEPVKNQPIPQNDEGSYTTFIELFDFVQIDDQQFKLKINYSGGCKNDHRFECYFFEANKVQQDTLRLHMLHFSEDLCYAIKTDSMTFRLAEKVKFDTYQFLAINNYSFPLN
jgi:hypothetical protein